MSVREYNRVILSGGTLGGAPLVRDIICAGEYRYLTEIGCFGLSHVVEGWSIGQWTPEHGTVTYGIYPTMRDADAAMLDLLA